MEKWKEDIPSRGIKRAKVLGKDGDYRLFEMDLYIQGLKHLLANY